MAWLNSNPISMEGAGGYSVGVQCPYRLSANAAPRPPPAPRPLSASQRPAAPDSVPPAWPKTAQNSGWGARQHALCAALVRDEGG
ncbi:hypothetical protein CCMA1212_000987 [Trichoderma ghanense]|uniref:Uncharacterized protein n=1 Tax=Trichoderma ghanense TaxID=65468 RepID=A0ABY2HK65_9HYPO